MTDRAEDAEQLAKRIAPLLAGQSPEHQGAALADLLATFIAGHIVVGKPRETARLRAMLLTEHVKIVRKLIAISAPTSVN